MVCGGRILLVPEFRTERVLIYLRYSRQERYFCRSATMPCASHHIFGMIKQILTGLFGRCRKLYNYAGLCALRRDMLCRIVLYHPVRAYGGTHIYRDTWRQLIKSGVVGQHLPQMYLLTVLKDWQLRPSKVKRICFRLRSNNSELDLGFARRPHFLVGRRSGDTALLNILGLFLSKHWNFEKLP